MKKTLLTLSVVLLAVAAQAQFKVHDNGHVSIGSLTTSYGIQVQPNGYSYFRPQYNTDYGWVANSFSNKTTMLNWMVTNFDPSSNEYDDLVFYVKGNGTVWARNHYTYGTNHINVRDELDRLIRKEHFPPSFNSKGTITRKAMPSPLKISGEANTFKRKPKNPWLMILRNGILDSMFRYLARHSPMPSALIPKQGSASIIMPSSLYWWKP